MAPISNQQPRDFRLIFVRCELSVEGVGGGGGGGNGNFYGVVFLVNGTKGNF